MNTLILTIQLMTRIPIKKQIDVDDKMLSRGVAYWPVVGVIIGLFQACIFWLCTHIFPVSIAAVLAVLSELCITGGFHLDGLCDTADAIYSARTRERMLEIMKDSRVGTNGVIAAFFDLTLKILLVMHTAHPVIVLILAPIAGKMVQGILMYKAVYPRDKGLGHSYIGRISLMVCLICTCLGGGVIAIVMALTMHWWMIAVVPVCLLAAFGFRRYIEGKIGGMTGDTLGAGSEVIEILFYTLCVIATTLQIIEK